MRCIVSLEHVLSVPFSVSSYRYFEVFSDHHYYYKFHQVGEMIAGGFGTTAFRPQQAQRTHAQETKTRSFPNVSLW